MGKPRTGERGFTLIEMMITVAVIALLAVVVYPMFWGESRKAKAKTEISSFFAELSQKEEAYKTDNGAYLTTAACSASAPTTSAQAVSGAVCASWTTLRVSPPTPTAYCQYVITAGVAGSTPAVPGGFTMPACAPTCAVSYYMILATCEMDGNSAVHSTYFTNSTDSTIQVQNEGK